MNAKMKPFTEFTREEMNLYLAAMCKSTKMGEQLEKSGVALASVAKLPTVSAGDFEQFISTMSLEQLNLLRDYFKSLLVMSEAAGGGEVDLTTIVGPSQHTSATDTGFVTYLHETISVIASLRSYEATIGASKNSKLTAGLNAVRKLEAEFEHHADEMTCQFVA